MTTGQGEDIESDYSAPAVFTFPTITVEPAACLPAATFSCQFTSSPAAFTFGSQLPAGGLCNDINVSNEVPPNTYTTTNTFFENNGGYSFDSNDKDNFPIGTYKFTITVTIGSKSVPVQFDMVLHDPCDD